jgi:hypothetical protein
LELFWIQYVVAYDRQEQRTLAGQVRKSLSSLQDFLASAARGIGARLSSWAGGDAPNSERRDGLFYTRLLVALSAAGFLLFVAVRGVRHFQRRRKRGDLKKGKSSAVIFYERMARALEARGLLRAEDQTPLEFAAATGLDDALTITRAFNRVRYGAQLLSPTEADEIERCLRRMEEKP